MSKASGRVAGNENDHTCGKALGPGLPKKPRFVPSPWLRLAAAQYAGTL